MNGNIENSMEAFQNCADNGVQGVELDVHLCLTGEAVVIHDSDLMRMTGEGGKVEELSWEVLKKRRIGKDEEERSLGNRIPLLEDVISSFSSSLYFDIELKPKTIPSPSLIRKTSAIIKRYGMEKKVMISSFNPLALILWKRLGIKEIPTGLIYSEGEGVPRFLQHGNGRFLVNCDVLKPHSSLLSLSRKFLKGHHVLIWGDPIPSPLDYAPDGIITDFPQSFM